MKKLMALAALSLTACVDTSTPQGALKSVYVAVGKGKVDDFKKVTGGEFRAEYGHSAGLATLKREWEGYDRRRLSIEEPRLTDNSESDRWWESYVLGIRYGGQPVGEAGVACAAERVRRTICDPALRVNAAAAPDPRPIPDPRPPTCIPRQETLVVRTCSVMGLTKY